MGFVALAAVVVISCVSDRLTVISDDSEVNRVRVNRVQTSLILDGLHSVVGS